LITNKLTVRVLYAAGGHYFKVTNKISQSQVKVIWSPKRGAWSLFRNSSL